MGKTLTYAASSVAVLIGFAVYFFFFTSVSAMACIATSVSLLVGIVILSILHHRYCARKSGGDVESKGGDHVGDGKGQHPYEDENSFVFQTAQYEGPYSSDFIKPHPRYDPKSIDFQKLAPEALVFCTPPPLNAPPEKLVSAAPPLNLATPETLVSAGPPLTAAPETLGPSEPSLGIPVGHQSGIECRWI